MTHPSVYRPELTDDRLRLISSTLLDVLHDTDQDLSTELDCTYTRHTTTFGRQRNAIIMLCQSGAHGWLKLTNGAMDVTFEIGGVPCRFFADDPDNPKKHGYWRRNESDQLLPVRKGDPVMFRFVVERATHESEADVKFIAYDECQEEVFCWSFFENIPAFTLTGDWKPEPVELPVAKARFPKSKDGSDDGDVQPDARA